MKHRIRTKVVVALALACAAAVTTAAPAQAGTEDATIRLYGPSEDSGTWHWDVESSGSGARAAALPPPGWICTPVVAPPTFGVTCTLPTVKRCAVDVTATASGGPGTVTGTVWCGPVTTAATATAPGTAASTTSGNGTMPPFTCTAATTGTPAPWLVTCHASMVSVP
jgi:hypothetical protein